MEQDVELRQRLVYGDESALGEVYDSYGGLVFTVAARVTKDRGAAEDVAQEVFARLWERPLEFEPAQGNLRSWLGMLAHRRAVDWVRAEERRRRLSVSGFNGTSEPDLADVVADSLDRQRDGARVREALEELPENMRQAVELAYFAGRTYREVAAELGIPEGTAKSRLRTGLRRLATALAGKDGTP